ncbi:MAG: hypothetical protein ABIX37_03135 [Gammaproteobacteria bacterium]
MHMRMVAAAVPLLFVLAPAFAASDDVTALRAELEHTKELVQQLETRLAAVENAARPEESAQVAPVSDVVAAAAAGSGSSVNAFNPAISAVLQGSYNAYSRNPDDAVISGFVLGDEAGLPNEGFSLGESEINLSANIDQTFYGSLTAALADDGEGATEISLEEAFIETLALPYGAKIKAGRMFPVVGYLNEIHAHADSFVDRPLPYLAYFGGANYADDGLQLSLVLPTDLYAEIGGGAFRGTGFPAAGSDNSGNGSQTMFARMGGDIGASQSWLAGLSYLHANAVDRVTGDLTFNGVSDVYVADAKYIWSPNGNIASRFLGLQGEYLWNRTDGTYNDLNYKEKSGGWYVQAVYRFLPQWKVGYRIARMTAPNVPAAFIGTALDSEGHEPLTQSLLLEFANSEFSSLRLQYTRDDSGPETDSVGVLLYTISMGAHGAHKY